MSTQAVSQLPDGLKSLSVEQLKKRVEDAPGDIIQGFLPEKSLVLFAGDSGLGKTPLLVQMGLCVAEGVPFLDEQVRPGPNRVLHVDYENGESGLVSLVDALKEHLNLAETPQGFRILSFPASEGEVEREIQLFAPLLVTIDSLRGFNPKAEGRNVDSGEWLTRLHKLAIRTGTTILLLHHLRKTDRQNPSEPLIKTPLMSWMQDVAGARSLVNQTDVRIGIEAHDQGETELVIKSHYKLRGNIGPWHIARKYDEQGKPIGYFRLRGIELLPQDHKDAFKKLGVEFTYSQAEKALGKKGRRVTTFLGSCQAAGVLAKYGQGRQSRYRKVQIAEAGSGEAGSAVSPPEQEILMRPVPECTTS